MSEPAMTKPNLMAVWLRHRDETRAIGRIYSEAEAGTLPGVEPHPSGYGFQVVDEAAALTAMRKEI